MDKNTATHVQPRPLQSNEEISVCVLASGSKGNSVFISDGETSILVDSGLSGVEIERRMKIKGLAPDRLDGVIVSHEHTDHISGAGVLSRRLKIPVYITEATFSSGRKKIGKPHSIVNFQCGKDFMAGSLKIHPFSIPHDAVDPAGFTISSKGFKIGIATDLGMATAMATNRLLNCNLLVIEANHDPVMLATGPYPWPLKQRVKGRTGHLSNEEAAYLVETVYHPNLEHVILAHLSEENNTPEKAEEAFRSKKLLSGINLHVAHQLNGSDVIRLGSDTDKVLGVSS